MADNRNILDGEIEKTGHKKWPKMVENLEKKLEEKWQNIEKILDGEIEKSRQNHA